MGDEDAFLRAIADAPADHAPRLVYADWLDEHGQPERAEYLRLRCERDETATLDRLRQLVPLLDSAWVARVHRDDPIVHPFYVVLREVGRGAMTTVYEATTIHPNLRGRLVAIRTLNDRQDPARFLNACQVHAAIQHAHIPPLYEVGEIGGRPYAVRMFVDGDDLLNNIRARVVDPPAVVGVVTTAAAALDAVHGQGIVHGCVHPRHLLRDREGGVWLIGFGEADPLPEVIGNPLHLAPEQLDPAVGLVGPRTDVYQLAETAAWLLGGLHPFQVSRGIERLLAAKQAENGWRTELVRDLPARVTAALRRAMWPDPAGRYPTAGEFAAALADGFQERPRSWWRVW